MPKHMLSPQGDYAPAGLIRRLAAMFYDFLLCVALMMVVTLVYQQGILRLIYGSDHLRELADRGALIGDPLLSTLLVFALFGFFAKFWTHNGQTLGMQVWGQAYVARPLFGEPGGQAAEEHSQEVSETGPQNALFWPLSRRRPGSSPTRQGSTKATRGWPFFIPGLPGLSARPA